MNKLKISSNPIFKSVLSFCLSSKQSSVFVLIVSFLATGNLWGQTFPVTTNTIVSPPSSVYLSDYFDATADRLQIRTIFNDLNEPSVDIRLRITIESSRIRLQTKDDANVPLITLSPNVPTTFTGEDLEPYLSYNNLNISGTTIQNLITNNGKLPEGFYTFCVEVLEYQSKVVISNRSCQSVALVLNDEPMTVLPTCGTMLRPIEPQNIMFQWQLSNNISPNNGLNTEYQLTLYEITDFAVDPLNAVGNGKALLIFQSEFINQTQLLYDVSAPQLDEGKRYVFRVQARNIDDRGRPKDIFKNQGFSQYCWFAYGSPLNGVLTLQSPKDKYSFKEKDEPYFQWKTPSNISNGQNTSYSLKIVTINDKQVPQEAIESNEVWHEETTPNAPASGSWDLILKKVIEKEKQYAWQVIANVNGKEVAKSEIWTFSGAPLLQKFLAGMHEVSIKKINNTELEKLSGTGEVKIAGSGETLEIDFNDLKIINVAGRLVLEAGEITKDISKMPSIVLSPNKKENQDAFFVPKTFKLNKNQMGLLGIVKWALPHPTNSGKADSVQTSEKLMNFDNYKINGNIVLDESNDFNLLEPLNFRMKLLNNSDFLIKDNEFTLRLNGEVYLPEKVKGFEKEERVMLPFLQANQLFYIKSENLALANNINALKNTKIGVLPKNVIIDFSENESPLKLAQNKAWKGVYFEKFSLEYLQIVDLGSQLFLDEKLSFELALEEGNEVKSWVSAQGLDLEYKQELKEKNKVWFNQFSGKLLNISVKIENSLITESQFKGNIKIPVISPKEDFAFTMPMADNGFQTGYLDESLEGKVFTFNENNIEQKVETSIKRAVFADKQRLDMVIDASWSHLKIALSNLSNFKVWGNGNIGFSEPNGSQTLSEQVSGELNSFPITVFSIGAAYIDNNYAFAIKANVVMAEDVSGEQGAPVVTLFSAAESQLKAEPMPTTLAATLPTNEPDEYATVANKNKIEFKQSLFGRKQDRNETGKIIMDSTYIKVNVAIASFEGMVKMTYDHPDWGDSWQGAMFATVSIPADFRLNVIFINGRKSDMSYWFIQVGAGVGAPDNDSNSNLSAQTTAGSNNNGSRTKIGKLAKIRGGIPLGPYVSLTGIDFRLYHHMNHSEAGRVDINSVSELDFVPDAQTLYGGYMRAQFIDNPSQGELAKLSVSIEVAVMTNNNFSLGIEGHLDLGNSRTDENTVDSTTSGKAGSGYGILTYNSARKHWAGEFDLAMETPAFCAEGSLKFDVQPSKWSLELGSSNERIKVTPGCSGWGFQGWFIINQELFDLGVGISFTAKAESPKWINIGIAKVKPFAEMGLVVGGMGKVQYKPKVVLRELGIWAEVWVVIGSEYETFFKSGTLELASAKLSGNLVCRFVPKPTTLVGNLSGEVEIMGVGTSFSLGLEHKFN